MPANVRVERVSGNTPIHGVFLEIVSLPTGSFERTLLFTYDEDEELTVAAILERIQQHIN